MWMGHGLWLCHSLCVFVFVFYMSVGGDLSFHFDFPSESVGIFCSLEIYLHESQKWALVKFGVDSQMGSLKWSCLDCVPSTPRTGLHTKHQGNQMK